METSPDGLTPAQQVKKIDTAVATLSERQQSRWTELRNELAKEAISLLTPAKLASPTWIGCKLFHAPDFFRARRRRRRCGASVPAYPEPGTGGGAPMRAKRGRRRAALDVRLRRHPERARPLHPAASAQWRRPETRGSLRCHRDGHIAVCRTLLPASGSQPAGLFRPLRNSEIEFQEKSEDLQKVLREALDQRQLGEVIRLEISASLPEAVKASPDRGVGIAREDTVVVDGLFALADISTSSSSKDRPDLLYDRSRSAFRSAFPSIGNDCFAAISSKDIVVHHPYESFDIVLDISAGGLGPGCSRDQMDALPDLAGSRPSSRRCGRRAKLARASPS